jgi:CRP-like cAMP-binding protein
MEEDKNNIHLTI